MARVHTEGRAVVFALPTVLWRCGELAGTIIDYDGSLCAYHHLHDEPVASPPVGIAQGTVPEQAFLTIPLHRIPIIPAHRARARRRSRHGLSVRTNLGKKQCIRYRSL
jgi:hypothetical protein